MCLKVNRISGFTIVELLIVVVVIAILAAIVIVSYNGISRQAQESVLKSDLKNGATQLEVEKTNTGSYPPTSNDLKKSNDTVFVYTFTSETFCLQATTAKLPGVSFYVTRGSSILSGVCPVTPTVTMQEFTTASCSALPVYNGTNQAAIVTLVDNRGGTNQTYEIAKLADNKCWMLANLKLGSTSSTTALTPSDSNIGSAFTLPQLATSGASSFDAAGAYGTVSGDTGANATNYGYLYNWPAATAGETRTTKPAGSADASYSICPANWRLPSGGDTGDFALLNAKMNNPSATGPSTGFGTGYYENWLYTGPFKGTFSGLWSSGAFSGQNTYGRLWSRSTSMSSANYAFYIITSPSSVTQGVETNRSIGLSVRCLLI